MTLLVQGLLLLALAGRTHVPGEASEALAAVRSALTRAAEQERRDEGELLRRLVALGPSAAPALFSLVSGEAIEELFGADDAPGAWLCAPDRVGELALAALAQLPPGSVIAHLRARNAGDPGRDVRVTEVRVLGSLGKAQGIELLLELVRAFGHELVLRPVRAPVVEALVAILRRDAQAFSLLAARAPELLLEEQRVLCEALTASAEPEGAGLLLALLGRDVELDLAALLGLVELEERYPWRMHFDLAAELRPRLTAQDARLRAQSALAYGRLGEGASAPALIACLDDADADVVRAAAWSLRELSGRKDLVTGAEWRSWYVAEHDWWKRMGEGLCRDLEQRATSALVSTLAELLAHPLARVPAAEALAGALPALAPEGQALACRLLAQLGSRRVVPALVELLGEEESVRRAAWEALRALTGADLPPEPRLWERYAYG